MPRPSQAQDQALLASGRRLYPALGCAGLSVRRLAEDAGVNPAMVHYHFQSKDGFLRALLQQIYEDLFQDLRLEGSGQGDARQRLAAALLSLARFVREHRPTIARLWADAQAGEAVALDFLRANAPRHLGLLLPLAAEAQRAGLLRPAPPLQCFVFLMGAVVAPIVIGGGVLHLGVLPPALQQGLQAEALSDEALRQRVDWALEALGRDAGSPHP